MLELESDLMQISRGCMINPSKKRRTDFLKKTIILQDMDEEFYFEDNFKEAVELLR